jgi:hypothetical protein
MKNLSLLCAVASMATLSALASAQHLRSEDESAGESRELMNTIVRYNWKLCDQCTDNPNDMCLAQGIIKGRKTRRSCDFSPCDATNDKVNNRGWFCAKDTDAVLFPQGSKQDARRAGKSESFTLQPSHPANEPAGVEFIPPQQAVFCVPCNQTASGDPGNGWCDPQSGDKCDGGAVCKSCDALFPDNADVKGRGWLCNKKATDSPEVCVNGNAMAHVNISQFAQFNSTGGITSISVPRNAFASTIALKRCKDTPFCLWGSVAGTVVLIIATLGVAAYLAPEAFAVAAEVAPAVAEEVEMVQIEGKVINVAGILDSPGVLDEKALLRLINDYYPL